MSSNFFDGPKKSYIQCHSISHRSTVLHPWSRAAHFSSSICLSPVRLESRYRIFWYGEKIITIMPEMTSNLLYAHQRGIVTSPRLYTGSNQPHGHAWTHLPIWNGSGLCSCCTIKLLQLHWLSERCFHCELRSFLFNRSLTDWPLLWIVFKARGLVNE